MACPECTYRLWKVDGGASKSASEGVIAPFSCHIFRSSPSTAFCVGTAGGVVMAKIMTLFSKEKINPLIDSAGVAGVLYTLCR